MSCELAVLGASFWQVYVCFGVLRECFCVRLGELWGWLQRVGGSLGMVRVPVLALWGWLDRVGGGLGMAGVVCLQCGAPPTLKHTATTKQHLQEAIWDNMSNTKLNFFRLLSESDCFRKKFDFAGGGRCLCWTD